MSSQKQALILLAAMLSCWAAPGANARSPVWKVTAPNGASLYLGGSIHGLLSTDYPLPSAFNRAFEDSSALVIEDDPNISLSAARRFYKSGFYPKNDSLKNHVDPRTYEYLGRVFALNHVPEAEWSKCKAWMLTMTILGSATNQLGIEAYLMQRARANHERVFGIESFREHAEVISDMTDQQAESVLLFNLIPRGEGTGERDQIVAAWRKGDVNAIAKLDRQVFHDLPSFGERLINQRNRRWVPKIEDYLAQRRRYFVVVGAGHLGGPQGVLELLRRRGYQCEQL